MYELRISFVFALTDSQAAIIQPMQQRSGG